MNLKTNFILTIIGLITAMIAVFLLKSDNNELVIRVEEKTKIIDSLSNELRVKEYEYEKYDILLQELDTPTLMKIDSVLQNIE